EGGSDHATRLSSTLRLRTEGSSSKSACAGFGSCLAGIAPSTVSPSPAWPSPPRIVVSNVGPSSRDSTELAEVRVEALQVRHAAEQVCVLGRAPPRVLAARVVPAGGEPDGGEAREFRTESDLEARARDGGHES